MKVTSTCGRGEVALLNRRGRGLTEKVSSELRLEGGRGMGYAYLGENNDSRQRRTRTC